MTDFSWQLPSFDSSDQDFKRYISEDYNYNHHTGDSLQFTELAAEKSFSIHFGEIIQKLNLDPTCEIALTSHKLSHPSKLHSHDYLEIAYVAKGQVLHILDSTTYLMEEGSFCLVPPARSHLVAPYGQESPILINFLIHQSLLEKIAHLTASASAWHHLDSPIMMARENLTPIITHHIQRFILNYFQADYKNNLSTIAAMLNLLQYIEDSNQEKWLPLDNLTLACLNLIEERPTEMTQAKLSQKLSYSPSYLSRHIKQATGKTISQHIATKKLGLAQKLLLETDLPISEIALEAGYQSESHFHRLFKEQHTITPGQYRKWMTV